MGSFPNPIDPSRDELFRQFLTAQSHGIDPCQIQIPPEFIATRVPSRFDPMPGPFYSLPSKLRDRASPLIVPYIHKVLRDRECQRVREMEIRLKGVPARPQKETPLSGQDALALLKGSGRSEVVVEPREDDVMDDEFMDGPEIIVNEKIERLSTSDVLDEDVDVVPSEIANAPPYHPPWSHRFQRTFSSAFQNYASQLQQYICGPPQPTPHVHGWAGTVVIQVLQTLRACPVLERYRYSAPFLSRLHHPSDILQASILHLVELSRNVPMAMQTDKRKTQDCACHRTRSFVSVYSPTLPDFVPQSQPPGYDNPKKNVLRRDNNSNCPRISNAALPRELIKVRGYRFKRSEEDGLSPRRVVVLTEDLAPNEGLSPRDCAKAVASAIARDQTQHQSISESPLPPCRLEVVGSTDHPGLPLMITTVVRGAMRRAFSNPEVDITVPDNLSMEGCPELPTTALKPPRLDADPSTGISPNQFAKRAPTRTTHLKWTGSSHLFEKVILIAAQPTLKRTLTHLTVHSSSMSTMTVWKILHSFPNLRSLDVGVLNHSLDAIPAGYNASKVERFGKRGALKELRIVSVVPVWRMLRKMEVNECDVFVDMSQTPTTALEEEKALDDLLALGEDASCAPKTMSVVFDKAFDINKLTECDWRVNC